ncbi:MAG: hydrogenase 3 maturation endopeptidase HyCI [Anaerolineaceae bacterium]|nr:hydrogenase 3 maturation endopeptidase HyCI [Anaerolineaceae bacterium]
MQPSWQEALKNALRSLAKDNPPGRLAILGVGNELNGDDGAGVKAARSLRSFFAGFPQGLIIEAGLAPENFTGPLRRFQPELVLIIDAGQMDEPPGTVAWVKWQETTGFSASSHSLPPSVLATYLIEELNCQVALLVIQVANTELGAPISPSVKKAVSHIVHTIKETFRA